jgi:hypothetical protein
MCSANDEGTDQEAKADRANGAPRLESTPEAHTITMTMGVIIVRQTSVCITTLQRRAKQVLQSGLQIDICEAKYRPRHSPRAEQYHLIRPDVWRPDSTNRDSLKNL